MLSIELYFSSQPAVAGDSVKPGVERSGTQEPLETFKAREAADSGINAFSLSHQLSPAPRALRFRWVAIYAIARYRGLERRSAVA